MFYDRFLALCADKGVSPSRACTELGLSRSSTRRWREGNVPRSATLTRMAAYFGVTPQYLLGTEKEKSAPEEGGHGAQQELPEDVRVLVEKLLKLDKSRLEVLAAAAEAMLHQQEK